MGSKLASRSTRVAKEVKSIPTDAQMIQEIRNLRAGLLAELNASYIDALLRAHDALVESVKTTNLVMEEGIAKIEELRAELAVKQQANDGFTRLTGILENF
jgi:hypothetical protein